MTRFQWIYSILKFKSYSDELRSNIRSEIGQSKDKLETTAKLTADALKRANDVYNEALTLFASVNSLTAPQINVEKLKKDAAQANEQVWTGFLFLYVLIFTYLIIGTTSTIRNWSAQQSAREPPKWLWR